ncbi:hypothetical protein [Yersinia ruckeri]|nr:hypothetical protein [Yersinia ruckeri]
MTLQQNKDISLVVEKEFTLKAQSIQATADKSLAISGKSSVEIKGAKINLTQ